MNRITGLPHVHRDQPDAGPDFRGDRSVEEIHRGFAAVGAAEPDRPLANQIGHDDAVAVAGPDRDFIDADSGRSGWTGEVELLLHVELVDLLHGVPMEVHFGGDIFDRRGAATATDGENEASGVARVGGEPGESLAFHAAPRAIDAAEFELEEDRVTAAIQIAAATEDVVVRAAKGEAAEAADRFF